MSTASRRDRGESLVELLISISVLGVTGTGVMGAVLMVSSASAMHEQVSVSDSVLRTWAENLDDAPYAGCAAPSGVATPPEPSGWSGGPPAWTRSIDGATYTAAVSAVGYWSPTGRAFSSTCGTDSGLQRITLTVSAPGAGLPGTSGELVLTRRNPCLTTAPAGCSG